MKQLNSVLSIALLSTLLSCNMQQKTSKNSNTQSKSVSHVLSEEERSKLTPDEIISNLKKGNKNFVNGKLTKYDYNSQAKIASRGQYPEAIVLACVDSRVPVEEIFDMSIGDLFVGRVAGNVEDVDMIGSFEYGAAVAGSKVIVVLGHTGCGAVKSTINKVDAAGLGMEDLSILLSEIEPAVISSLKDGEERNAHNEDLMNRVVTKNVENTIADIRKKSPTLHKLETEGKLKIVGAVYNIETGMVNWL